MWDCKKAKLASNLVVSESMMAKSVSNWVTLENKMATWDCSLEKSDCKMVMSESNSVR